MRYAVSHLNRLNGTAKAAVSTMHIISLTRGLCPNRQNVFEPKKLWMAQKDKAKSQARERKSNTFIIYFNNFVKASNKIVKQDFVLLSLLFFASFVPTECLNAKHSFRSTLTHSQHADSAEQKRSPFLMHWTTINILRIGFWNARIISTRISFAVVPIDWSRAFVTSFRGLFWFLLFGIFVHRFLYFSSPSKFVEFYQQK